MKNEKALNFEKEIAKHYSEMLSKAIRIGIKKRKESKLTVKNCKV